MIKNYLFALAFFIQFASNAQHEIWGTVGTGGENNFGYIYKSDAEGNNLTIIHHFQGTDGYSPGALLAASNNKLYGVTTSGGDQGTTEETLFNGGVLYEVDLATETFTVLKNFSINNTEITGLMPMGTGFLSLTEVSTGIIYGNIRSGISDRIFSYNIEENTLTSAAMLPTFNGGAMNTPHGMRLNGALYLAEDGYLYGATYERSECPIANPNGGSIIRIDPATNTITIPYMASCTPVEGGYIYRSNFVSYGDELYSVALEGGDFYKGVLYSYNPVTDVYTKKYDFDGVEMGFEPNTLVKASNGKLYGTTVGGGFIESNVPYGGGILYEFDPEAGVFIKKYDFTYQNGDYMLVGIHPQGPMIEGSNGKLYGVARTGIYEYDTEANTVAAKGRFSIEYPYENGYPSLTAVCRKPIYNQTQTSLQACPGEAFSFDLQSPNSETVTWFHNDIEDASQTGTVLSFETVASDDAGEWKAVLANDCGTVETHVLTLSATAVPVVIVGDATLTTDTAAESYQWINCGTNMPIDGAETAYYTPMANGSYAVTVTTGSCSVTSECAEYTFMAVPGATIPALKIFPNPVGNIVHIEGIESSEGSIVNLLGQKVMAVATGSNDVSGLASGTYLIIFHTTEGIIRQKLVKE